jgi:hypothetical protein
MECKPSWRASVRQCGCACWRGGYGELLLYDKTPGAEAGMAGPPTMMMQLFSFAQLRGRIISALTDEASESGTHRDWNVALPSAELQTVSALDLSSKCYTLSSRD